MDDVEIDEQLTNAENDIQPHTTVCVFIQTFPYLISTEFIIDGIEDPIYQ